MRSNRPDTPARAPGRYARSSSRRMPGSSECNAMDSGMHRNDGLIRRSPSDFMAELVIDPGTGTKGEWRRRLSSTRHNRNRNLPNADDGSGNDDTDKIHHRWHSGRRQRAAGAVL